MNKINKCAYLSLKAQFTGEAMRTRALRALRARLIRDGRKLRVKAAMLQDNPEKSKELRAKADTLTEQGLHIRDEEGPREVGLALAFLNNTAYRKAEAKAKEAPDAFVIAILVKRCLLDVGDNKVDGIIKQWLEIGHIKKSEFPRDICSFIEIKEIQDKINKAKKNAEHQFSFHSGVRNLAHAKRSVKAAEEQIVREQKIRDDQAFAILELEEKLEELLGKQTLDLKVFLGKPAKSAPVGTM